MATTGIVPAQLGFLAIYNPSLGATDDTLDDQIVYYASVTSQTRKRRHRSRARPTEHISHEERNERLRQIGLAQGMVEFGKSFSGDVPVNTIDTEKSRVVLHELEPGWWILASIDLTRLRPLGKGDVVAPSASSTRSSDSSAPGQDVEYSSREVKPAALLLQDILRAHSVFLLHHNFSLSALFVRTKRSKFIGILGRYWDLFLTTWNVMLHGNPASNIFGAIKIAACGELGVGVGEEDRGSGEREVLEGLAGRIEGLVDLVVAKFEPGDQEQAVRTGKRKEEARNPSGAEQWLGTGNEPGAEDGTIFLGIGALSRHSLRSLSYWMEDLYRWGENAYGVVESPTSTRQVRRPKRTAESRGSYSLPTRPPPPILKTSAHKEQESSSSSNPPEIAPKRASSGDNVASTQSKPDTAPRDESSAEGGWDKFVNSLKMGYGTHWSLSGTQAPKDTAGAGNTTTADPTSPGKDKHVVVGGGEVRRGSTVPNDTVGHYLIGLQGDIEDAESDGDGYFTYQDAVDEEYNSRTLLRTVTVELENGDIDVPETEVAKDLGSHEAELQQQKLDNMGGVTRPANTSFDNQDRNKTRKLRIVVYVNKPFVYVLLFQLHTDSLAWDRTYRTLHHQLAPLTKPLLASTLYRHERPISGSIDTTQIYDLVWDPHASTLHSTIPNIPDPLSVVKDGGEASWSRVEALNTHMQLLNMYTATRFDIAELERTCKTNRGWWIVWSRILEQGPDAGTRCPSSSEGDKPDDARSEEGSDKLGQDDILLKVSAIGKEIFLIRRASDHGGSGARALSTAYTESGGWADGASRLAQGIGVDTKKYIEGLLSLNR